MDIEALFCDLDDFFQAFAPTLFQHLLPAPGCHYQRSSQLAASEITVLLVAFHGSNYRTFKHFYLDHVCCYRRG